jgi:hypothetical protein
MRVVPPALLVVPGGKSIQDVEKETKAHVAAEYMLEFIFQYQYHLSITF